MTFFPLGAKNEAGRFKILPNPGKKNSREKWQIGETHKRPYLSYIDTLPRSR
jgi:hypothetical protein